MCLQRGSLPDCRCQLGRSKCNLANVLSQGARRPRRSKSHLINVLAQGTRSPSNWLSNTVAATGGSAGHRGGSRVRLGAGDRREPRRQARNPPGKLRVRVPGRELPVDPLKPPSGVRVLAGNHPNKHPPNERNPTQTCSGAWVLVILLKII